jgi:hypothetical protein
MTAARRPAVAWVTARPVLLAALGCLSFFTVAAALRQLTLWPNDFEVSSKLRYLRRHASEFDVLFVGSSRVYRGFDPEAFDERLAEHGLTFRSFNLGGEGVNAYEADHIVRELLASGARPRILFVELQEFDPQTRQDSWILRTMGAGGGPRRPFTRRNVNWHSLSQTLLAIRVSLQSDLPLADRLLLAANHFNDFARRLTSYGMGAELIGAFDGAARPVALTDDEMAARRGFQSMDEVKQRRWRQRAFAKRADRFQSMLETNRESVPESVNAFTLAPIAEQARRIRGAGIEPFYVRVPGLGYREAFRGAAADGVTIFDFDDPDAHPQLFRVDLRFDEGHLNAIGAALFSRKLASAFARVALERGY